MPLEPDGNVDRSALNEVLANMRRDVPIDEIFVSEGTANMLDDEIAIYTAEPVALQGRHLSDDGVLVCSSRAGMGPSTTLDR